MKLNQSDITALIMASLQDWYDLKTKSEFVPGTSYIKVAQPNNPVTDYLYMVKAILEDHWVEGGKYTEQAEEMLSEIVKQDYISFCGSGSSADLLAFSALSERFKIDTVLTTAVNFPTTISPAVRENKKIIFVDTSVETLTPNYDQIEEYIHNHPQSNIMIVLAHTLGFPFSESEILLRSAGSSCCFLADCCDALGSQIDGYPVGYLANLSTYSFYPAHMLNGIEMGAVCSNSKDLTTLVESYRNWGRDCYCKPNEDNTCGQRFNGKWGNLGKWDHKYVTARMGFNLKTTEINAALLCSQIPMTQAIQEGRFRNFCYMKDNLSDLSEYFDFIRINEDSVVSPFGFPILCRGGIDRLKLIRYLENHKIGTRLVFGGNLAKQPGFLPHVRSGQIQTPFPLTGADNITDNSFWISCNQNLIPEQITYMVEIIHQAVKQQVDTKS